MLMDNQTMVSRLTFVLRMQYQIFQDTELTMLLEMTLFIPFLTLLNVINQRLLIDI